MSMEEYLTINEEVARMLGGVKITEKTKRHAEEMVKMQGSRQ